jgi:DNA-directed RNA polymerase specialized sigma24 family protein
MQLLSDVSNAMESRANQPNDRDLRDRIIHGVHAFSELQDRFRRKLELHLIGHCKRSDGRSQEKAVEIASQVLADCFAKSPSLLEKWQGSDNLEAFLRTVAHNRLKSWWDSRDAATEVDSDSRAMLDAGAVDAPQPLDWDELRAAERALAAGVAAALNECPEGVLFMRLKGLHGVDQRVLSAVWGHHEAQTSRRIKEAMTQIRSQAACVAADSGIDPGIDLLQQALQGNPSILLGKAAEALEVPEMEKLRQLADGGLSRSERDGLTGLMCRNAQALEFFARLLNRSDGSAAVVVKYPEIEGMGAKLADCMRQTLEILRPSEAREWVSPLMSGLFADALKSIAADGGTLWWLNPGEAMLEAVFNPLEPEITGIRQPLVSGIISLVLATSETIRVGAVDSHQQHSPAIDAALGKTTRSMIAVPFRIQDQTRGVLTAVRLAGGEPFGASEAAVIERQAQALAVHFIAELSARITGVPV